jgi:hypothetical protein
MRADILELMAEEISGRPVDAQASFVGFEDGRPVLQGMSRGRLRDFDRPDRETRMAEELRAVEIKRLMKLRSRRRRPEVYRAQWQRYDSEHQEERAVARRRRYWADAARSRALRRAQRQKLATKRGRPQKTCGTCGQTGHNRRSHA